MLKKLNKNKILLFSGVLLAVLISVFWYSYSYSSDGYGEYESAISIPASPGDSPYLERPTWMAISPNNGNIYLSDRSNAVVLVFDSNDNYLFKIGSSGHNEGNLKSPEGVAVGIGSDGKDVVYIMDSLNGRIKKFDHNGDFVAQWGALGSGDNTDFYKPQDIALDSEGNVYVVESGNNLIKKFKSSGEYLGQWGGPGSENGKFSSPFGITVDSNNNIYISDNGNKRIQKFNSSGDYITQWGSAVEGLYKFENIMGISVDDEDNIYVLDKYFGKVEKFTSNGQFLETLVNENLDSSVDIEINLLGDIYISDRNHRIQKFSLGAKLGYFQDVKFKYGANGKFANPRGIFLDSENNIYVADTNNNRIQKFDHSGVFLDKWSDFGNNIGEFTQPTKLIKDSYGNIYILYSYNDCIQKFDSNWNFITQWGENGLGEGQFMSPMDIEIDGDYIYVADTKNDRIQKFDLSGGFIWQKGGIDGSADLKGPMGLAISSSSDIYVTDTLNEKIKIFSSNGTLLNSWGESGLGDGQFKEPQDIALDSLGNLYVVDTGNNRIQKFNSSGVYSNKWGSGGNSNGYFNGPTSIVINTSNTIYVLDSNNNRIQYFSDSGVFQGKWGEFGSSGFSGTSYLAIGSDNNVFISDPNKQDILKFSLNGDFIDTVQLLGEPVYNTLGFIFDSSDNLYIADKDQYIKKFGPEYSGQRTFMTSWGGAGNISGKFKYSAPVNMVVDSSNNIYIMDRDNNRIQKFGSGGTYQQEWTIQYPLNMAIDSNDNIYVTSKISPDRIAKIDSSGNFISDWVSGYQEGKNPSYYGIAVGSFNNIYISNSDHSYLKKFDSSGNFIEDIDLGSSYSHIFIDSLDRIYGTKGNNKDFDRFAFGESPAYVFDSKIGGEESIYFEMPFSVFLANINIPGEGDAEILLVSDFFEHNFKIFIKDDDNTLQLVDVMFEQGSELGQVLMPSKVIFVNNYFYVADAGNHRIQRLDIFNENEDDEIISWGIFGSGPGEFGGESLIEEDAYILGMTADSEGNIYVADTFNNRVQKFDGDGNYILEWAADSPFGITIDHNSNIFTSSSFVKNNIQKFDASGNLIKEFGGPGIENGQFNQPAGLHIDLNNHLYVADAGNNRIQKFDTEGNFIDVWGEGGINLGEFNNPVDVTVDDDGNIYVADAENKRVQILYIAPQTPYNLEVSNSNSNSLTLSWLGNTYEYNVENMDNLDASDWIKNNSYTFTNLICGKNYSFRVQGKSYSGTETDWSDILNYSIPCSSSGSNGSSPGGSSGVPLPVCDLVEYEAWEACKEGFNTQFRMIKKTEPTNCYLTVEQRQAMERSCSLNNEGENTNEGESESGNIEENNNGSLDQGYLLNIKNISLREKSLVSQVDPRLVNRLKGFLLLQTENEGELWYLNPIDSLKYYMGNPVATFNIMRMFGLGVSNKDFDLFEKNGVPDRLAGRIILKVESHGEAYYINPITMEMHYLSRPQAAFELLKKVTLGISNLSLRKIEVGLQ